MTSDYLVASPEVLQGRLKKGLSVYPEKLYDAVVGLVTRTSTLSTL